MQTPASLLVLACAVSGPSAFATQSSRDGFRPALVANVALQDPYFAPRARVCREVLLPALLDDCERSHRLQNLRAARGKDASPHAGGAESDLEVYRLLEALACSLATKRDAALERRIDAIVELVAGAQHDDGYLNTRVALTNPAERWKDMAEGRELQCAGALIDAGVAYAEATGKEALLEVALGFARRIEADFGPGKRLDPCGHPGLERALVRLARFTGEARFAELARFFVEQRGSRKDRGSFGELAQDHAPVREQSMLVGDVVRALDLQSGVVDVARWFQDETLAKASYTAWSDVVEGRLYATGGLGTRASRPGLPRAFELPNDSAHCGACASAAMVEWNHRLFLATGRSDVVDVLERVLYNALPAGLALSGDRMFEANPLASRGSVERTPPLDRGCSATDLARTLLSVGRNLYATDGDRLLVALYAESRAELDVGGAKVVVRQKSKLPWEGRVELTLEPASPVEFELWLRVPAWGQGMTVIAPSLPAGVPLDEHAFPREVRRRGFHYRVLKRTWKRGDLVAVEFDLTPRRVIADPKVVENTGRVAIARGPLLYAFEGRDNDGRARSLVLPDSALELESVWKPELLGGVTLVTAKGERVRDSDPFAAITEPATLTALPYALWANRGPNEMCVWIAADPARAERPGEGARLTRSSASLLRASSAEPDGALAALDDGVLGKSSADTEVPRLTFEPRSGSAWVELCSKDERTWSSSAVQWFDDVARGGSCGLPRRWRIVWRDGTEWKDVELVSGTYGTAADVANEVRFRPIRTRALRLEVEFEEGRSAGLLEWRVDPAGK